jgi:hypothetical protein
MPPDFLNSREDAILLWTVALLCYVTYKDAGWIKLMWPPLRTIFGSKLIVIFGFAALYSAGLVLFAERLGVWHSTSTKETVYWFGAALILVGKAIQSTPGKRYVRDVLRTAISVALLIAFAVNFYVLPRAYEIVLVFVVTVLTLGREVAPAVPNGDQSLRLMDRGLTVIGLYLLVAFGVRATLAPGALFTQETAERFLVAPVLTVALLPYLLGVAWYCRREVERVRRRFIRANA